MNLKKLNRGLLLGAVLIIGTASYVIYDNHRFKESKPEISATVENYFKNLSAVNTAGKDEIYDKATQLVNDNWAYRKMNDNEYFISKNDMISQIKVFEEDNLAVGYFKEFDVSVGDIKVSKNGPDCAVAYLSVDVYSEFFGSPAAMWPTNFTSTDDGYIYSSDYESAVDENDEFKSTRNYDTVVVYLKSVDGEWKITGIDDYGYSMDSQHIGGNDDDDDIEDIENTDDIKADDDNMESKNISEGGADNGN